MLMSVACRGVQGSRQVAQKEEGTGELWEKQSNGKCLFVMQKGKDLQALC